MPAKLSGYEKLVNRCNRVGWNTYPDYELGPNYDLLYKMVKYSDVKIQIGITYSPKKWEEYYDLLLQYQQFKRGVFLEKFIFIYGLEDGKLAFDEYRKKQAYTNTFEYKQKKYGFTQKDFENYNKSRAITLENLIKKYGEELGTQKFKDYCNRQAFTNSEEYLGKQRYYEVNRKKAHTIETYIDRYGEENGISKLTEFYGKLTPNKFYSKVSQEFFRNIENIFKKDENDTIYYATKNKEYCLIAENNIFLYDFVCPKLKLCIEYHGDHYHGNPKFYRPDDYLKGRGCTKIKAKEKWKADKMKIDLLKKYREYDTIVIWDFDWRETPENIIFRLTKQINDRRTLT